MLVCGSFKLVDDIMDIFIFWEELSFGVGIIWLLIFIFKLDGICLFWVIWVLFKVCWEFKEGLELEILRKGKMVLLDMFYMFCSLRIGCMLLEVFGVGIIILVLWFMVFKILLLFFEVGIMLLIFLMILVFDWIRFFVFWDVSIEEFMMLVVGIMVILF